MSEMAYRDAIRVALHEEMTRDDSVILMGEDVGRYGGAYGSTKQLFDVFGAERVIDSPISEAGIVGLALGAALTGLRPVVELMYIDFAALAMDQIANQVAKNTYMFNGQAPLPLTIRTQGGTGRSAGAQHSQSLEAWFMHTPGLRVAMPSTPADAKGLLKTAIRLDDPVVFIEHKGLYAKKDEVADDESAIDFGQCAIRRRGADVTLIAYSRMVHYALDAAEQLARKGIECEVLDLRTLNPLDIDGLCASVAKTRRAAIIEEDPRTAGVGAEIAATLTENLFRELSEPVRRIAALDIPIPAPPKLEQATVPSPRRIVGEVIELVNARESA